PAARRAGNGVAVAIREVRRAVAVAGLRDGGDAVGTELGAKRKVAVARLRDGRAGHLIAVLMIVDVVVVTGLRGEQHLAAVHLIVVHGVAVAGLGHAGSIVVTILTVRAGVAHAIVVADLVDREAVGVRGLYAGHHVAVAALVHAGGIVIRPTVLVRRDAVRRADLRHVQGVIVSALAVGNRVAGRARPVIVALADGDVAVSAELIARD